MQANSLEEQSSAFRESDGRPFLNSIQQIPLSFSGNDPEFKAAEEESFSSA